jgi:hypothetical protein
MATQVLDAITTQKPALRELLAHAKKKFAAITEVGVAPATNSKRTVFDAIATKIDDVWRDPEGFFRFFSWIFQLPLQIAKAVGVENVVIVADNIDLADIQLTAHSPFTNSGFLFFVELLKYALDSANFIVACQETDRCCQILTPTDEFGTDLLEGINFVSTMDIADQEFLEESNVRFLAEVEGDQSPLQLHARLCGGVEYFAIKWKDLCDAMGRLDSSAPGIEYDKAVLAAVNAAQQFVSLVFSPHEPGQEIQILRVLRFPHDQRL